MEYPEVDAQLRSQVSEAAPAIPEPAATQRKKEAKLQQRIYAELGKRHGLDPTFLREQLPKVAEELRHSSRATSFERASAAYIAKDYVEAERWSKLASLATHTINGDAEFQLFLNARTDIVSRCVYPVSDRAVIADALKALQREMGAGFDSTIPSDLDQKTAPEAWAIYKDTLLQLAQSKKAGKSLKDLVELSLDAYCKTVDRYSSYDSYETWFKSQHADPDYIGVGITLLTERADDIICVPIRGGPADRAGVQAGDHLLALNDHVVRGVSLMQIHNWLAGDQQGLPIIQTNEVKLRVRRSNGVTDTVAVPKEPITFSPVSVQQSGEAWQITLSVISDRCVTDLREQLRWIGPGKTIILDLRGCREGPSILQRALLQCFCQPIR